MEKHLLQKFRHRGFQPSDPAAEIEMMFGDGPVPQNPDGSEMKKLWDHDHEQHTVIKDHEDPVV